MKTNQQSNQRTDQELPRKYPHFHRRTAMQITGVGVIATAAGVWLARSTFAAQVAGAPFQDEGFRLYVLTNDDPYLKDAPPEMPRPIWVHAGRGQEASLFLWTTKEQAAQIDAVRLASDATLTPLAEKKPIDVKEVGSASASAGKLFVMFCPNVQDDEDANSNACKAANQHDTNSDDRPRPAYRYESINQIAAKWNAAFEKHGLAIQAVKATKPGLNVGHAMLNVGGQIEVKFKGQLAEDVVKTIKDHPQAASLSWGKPFTVMYCPGCGMG